MHDVAYIYIMDSPSTSNFYPAWPIKKNVI